jgi:CRISPR system Cascade subunit CasD
MEGLALRFDAPMMSFGGVAVDQHGVIDRFPGLSLITGLIGNALGYSHGDWKKLVDLQDRLLLASRWDAEPKHIVDYQTVDLGQEKMSQAGWTTHGITEHRDGGPGAKLGTHQRYRHYWANGILTLVISLGSGEDPDLEKITHALKYPERPLFLGRKACIPSSPILIGRVSGENVLEMLKSVPAADCRNRKALSPMPARWPMAIAGGGNTVQKSTFDQRNWKTQLHTGSRQVIDGFIEVPTCI